MDDDEYKKYFNRQRYFHRIFTQMCLVLGNKRISFASFENSFELVAKWIYVDPFIRFHFTLPISERPLREIVTSVSKTQNTSDYIDLIETLKRKGFNSAENVSSFLKID